MGFVLSDKFIAKLKSLRHDYEAKTGCDLKNSRQPNKIARFFGSIDIAARDKQISYIENWLAKLENDQKTDLLMGYRLMAAICLYTESQVDKTYIVRDSAVADINYFIDKAMGRNPKNEMDEETKAVCYRAAQRYLRNQKNIEPFTEKEWHNFEKFIKHHCKNLEKEEEINYPITSVTMPLFGQAFGLIGLGSGYVLGDLAGKALAPRYIIIATATGLASPLVASSPLVIYASRVVIAPVIARLLDTLCGVSLAWFMGSSLQLIGEGVGWGVGMPPDLFVKAVSMAVRKLMNLGKKQATDLTGLSLLDGRQFNNGIEVQVVHQENSSEELTNASKEGFLFQYTGKEFNVILDGEKRVFSLIGNQKELAKVKEIFEAKDEDELKLKFKELKISMEAQEEEEGCSTRQLVGQPT